MTMAHEVCTNFNQFLEAQEITRNIMENIGEWTEYVSRISENAKENREIASFFSSIITNLFRLNDNLKQTISTAKTILNDKKSPDSDRNAALLKRLMECAIDETDCNVNDNSSCSNQSMYDDGFMGIAYVSHISDAKNGICFLLDVEQMPDPMQLYGKYLKPLNRLPETGEVFAYHLNQKFMFRAIRCATSDSEAIAAGRYQYYARFIDIGNTMWIDTTNGFHNHYELDESVQQMPGYAIKCHIVQMPTHYNLMNILHDKVAFRILKMGNSLVYVELLSQSTNPFLCVNEVGGNNKQLYSYFNWNGATSSGQNNQNYYDNSNGLSTKMLPRSGRIEYASSSRSYTSNNNSYSPSSNGDKAVNNHFMDLINTTITKKADLTKQLTSYYDSSATNWNAHESRMQQFADTLSSDDENVYEHYENGVHSDVSEEPSVPSIRLPCIGDTVSISVSFVIDVERFYAFIPSCMNSNTMSVNQLQNEMNADHIRRNYQPLHLTPPINGRVFSIYKNRIYRARVIAHYDQLNFQVFYVDYGNCARVSLNELFLWDSRWDNVPSQIFLCRLHGMRKIRFFDFEAMTALEELLVNKTLKAKVTNIVHSDDNNPMVVMSVWDINGADVAQAMCDKNYAKPI